MKIFIVNGFPRSGKSKFCELIRDYLGENKVYILSTVDFVKEIATLCGWDGAKNGKNRKFLADLKNLLTEWDDVPIKKIKKELANIQHLYESYDLDTSQVVVFIMCREPNEIARLCRELGAKSLFISRDNHETDFSNTSDAEVENYNYDIYFHNPEGIENLFRKIENFIKEQNLI